MKDERGNRREEEMRSMMERLKGYLNKEMLELNSGKYKTMKFNNGGRKISKRNWKWKRTVIEEVKKYKYLRCVLQRNNKQKAQVKE